MVNPLGMPHPVEAKLMELVQIVEKHPQYIPVPELASFLGMDAACLRNSIEKGQCPFGLGWQRDERGYKGFKVPTVPFYLWYTQGVGFRN